MTKDESQRRAKLTGISSIYYWIENDIEAENVFEEMPILHHIPISYIKKPFLWSLFYLKTNYKFEDAIKDVIKRGGDTRSNAAIVGGLIGGVQGFNRADC